MSRRAVIAAQVVAVLLAAGLTWSPRADESAASAEYSVVEYSVVEYSVVDYSVVDYARECAARIADVPSFDCQRGTPVPITVDGQVPEHYVPHMTCDRPALLPYGDESDGQCLPYSRALVLRDDAEVQISAFCRQKLIRPEGTHLYDEIDVILHSVTSGSTCWFHAATDNPERDPSIGLDGRKVVSPGADPPPPGYPPPQEFWYSPADTASQNCGSCHDSDPFYYSPYIAQTAQFPADPLGNYANDIGAPFQAWPVPTALSTAGNTCTGCHRIGSEYTCQTGMLQSVGELPIDGLDARGQTYPYSHWMPVDNLWTEAQWNVIYRESIEKLKRCCRNPEAPGCISEPIPGSRRAR